MKFVLTKKPKNPIIILGIPSLSLVGILSTKYLLDHLDVDEIGNIESSDIIPMTAIHKSKLVNPITIYYNQKYNLVIIQSITEVTGHEWDLAKTIMEVANTLSAKEMVLIEAMPPHEGEMKIYYYSTKKKLKLDPIKEAVIAGPAASLLLEAKSIPVTCLFAEVHSQLPDYEAAAKIVESLDDYLGLKIDFKPLMETAKKFENSLKQVMEKQKRAVESMSQKEKKELSYFG